jgi:two-component system, cell cycle sensor histidine kinase and response regulator CckA
LATILVVDDERTVRRSVQMLLSDAGYRVLEAEGGPEALDVLAGGRHVDLVMTDVVMPRVDGVALVELLRRDLPTQRVLYMSAHPAEVLVRYHAVDLTTPFLAKPFTRAQLLAKLEQALAGPTPAQVAQFSRKTDA